MELQVSELGEVKKVALSGRLDTAGAGLIEASFAAQIVAPGKPTVVDLSEVAFLASLGIRMIIGTAHSRVNRCALKNGGNEEGQ